MFASRRNSFAAPGLGALLLVLVGLAAYSTSFSGALVFDDQSTLIENASIRQLWPLGPVLSPPPDAGICGRPLANLTMALNYAVSGTDPRSYHGVNVAIHLAAALALFGAVRRTLLLPSWRDRFGRASLPLAFLSALLWALHPLQTNAIDYLSQRVEALMGCFYFLTFYCFIRQVGTRSLLWSVATILSCLGGMASKEVMITAPVMVFLYDRTFVSGSFLAAWQRHRRLHLALAATWLFLAYLMFGAQLAHRGIGYSLGISTAGYALNECRVMLRYLQLSFWPAPLVFDYGWDYRWETAVVIPCALTIGLLGMATLVGLYRRPKLGFLGFWFFGVLAPSSSIVPIIQQPAAESRLYVSLAAVTTLGVIGSFLLDRRTMLIWPVVAVLWAGLTLRRHVDYRNELALWSDTVAKRPENARAHNNLGSALLRAHRLPEAITELETAVQLRPAYPDAHNNLGVALLQHGQPADATIQFEDAVQASPNSPDSSYNLGEAHAQLGQLPQAVADFEHVLQLNPAHSRAHNNLGVILLQLNRPAEAINHDRAAVQLDPAFSEAHYNLGNALARIGNKTEAIEEFRRASQLQPRFAKAQNNLGVLLLQSGHPREAAEQFKAALASQPDYPEARRNLAAVESQASP